jgi:hypothetical protein
LKTGRSYRAESEGGLTAAPAIITPELFEAQIQLQRNPAAAGRRYCAASGRYRLRTLVTCGECGPGLVGLRVPSAARQHEDLYKKQPQYADESYRLKNSGRRVPNRTGLEQKNVGQKNQASQVERYFSARHFSAAPNF